MQMNPLSSQYLGFSIASPIVVAACPLSTKLENLERMQDAGAGAVVLFSLFEEGRRNNGEPDSQYRVSSDDYLRLVDDASSKLNIPVIASLNGTNLDHLSQMTMLATNAGAHAVEYNPYHLPVDLTQSGRDIEEQLVELATEMRAICQKPMALKLMPTLSSPGNLALILDGIGVDGLVMFNRLYLPSVDTENMNIHQSVQLSRKEDSQWSIHWASLLYGKISSSIIGNSGIENAEQALQYLLSGASSVQVASCLIRNGIDYLKSLNQGLEDWMNHHECDDIQSLVGLLTEQRQADSHTLERLNYMKSLHNFQSPYFK
ncbi:hypothetical protein [Echinimonas agarilytica]|uniref:Dihydroorotate dehydrogenase catalytic domain-containing protein n=1 Tax=Echinimonas agarilytica TaxID=1215918 RepID=A0AA42B9C3_9GAMM|nr:hypothetical protein [Echinimonas agarilytica]MCM2681353.1 hypothetical protein [Echinimonas agarilytica]